MGKVHSDQLPKVRKKNSKLLTVKEFAQLNKNCGKWPSTESAIWLLRHNCSTNGFHDAFVSIGRSVFVDLKKFLQAAVKIRKINTGDISGSNSKFKHKANRVVSK